MNIVKRVVALAFCAVLPFQYAAAFSPKASVTWTKLSQSPYTWSYSATVYVDEYSSLKGDISANAYAFDIANHEIADTDSARTVYNVSSVTIGHGLSSQYNTAWLGAQVYGTVTVGQIAPITVEATGANKSLKLSINNMEYALLKNSVDIRDQAMVESFHTEKEEYIQYDLFDYLNSCWNGTDMVNGFDVLDALDLREGDSGLRLYKSPDETYVLVYKQDAMNINHEYKFEICDGYYELISHNTTQSTTPELEETIRDFSRGFRKSVIVLE